MRKTIIALATPPSKSALAVIRVSGNEAFNITDSLFNKKISTVKSRSSFVGKISDKHGMVIDEVVLLAYPAPRSMTGENVVEIFCHGNPLIADDIIKAYLENGAVYATRGEFTERAFLNGKVDLIEAEAVNDLINSTTREARALSLKSLSGQASTLVINLKNQLGKLIGLIETNIDYPEYDDVEEASQELIKKEVKPLQKQIEKILSSGTEARFVHEGIKVALIGKPNVGKSSLLNAFVKKDKALVSAIPGTTRDIVEGDVFYDGLMFHFYDTAGLHESSDFLEELGIKKTREIVSEADVLLWIKESEDKDEPLPVQKKQDQILIVVYNKDDLKTPPNNELHTSALKGEVENVLKAIRDKAITSEQTFSLPSLANKRQLSLLGRINSDLKQALEDNEEGAPLDLISASLLSAYQGLKALVGEEVSSDLEDEVFGNFCVGK